jgi:murein DD-endopeptidase MepM/ murein hydrolase activator NlpD
MFSSYCHMNEFKCAVGGLLEQGDTVGLVGSTGFSTGPHLHWGVSLHGTNINPLALVKNSPMLVVMEDI